MLKNQVAIVVNGVHVRHSCLDMTVHVRELVSFNAGCIGDKLKRSKVSDSMTVSTIMRLTLSDNIMLPTQSAHGKTISYAQMSSWASE
jgi:hypothetical protein